MKLLLLCIWGLSQALVMEIDGHCLRQSLPMDKAEAAAAAADVATRHMWRATGWPADTGSCAGPTTLRSAPDSHVAIAAGLAMANATTNATLNGASAQAVSLANYVYQCAAKRAPNPSPDLASTRSFPRPLQLQPQIALSLDNNWRGN